MREEPRADLGAGRARELVMTGRRPRITPRIVAFDFARSGRYWFRDSPALSRWLDAYTMLVPDNERYYVRTLQRCEDLNAEQLDELRRFIKQEVAHGRGHSAYWGRLEAAGIPVRRFTDAVSFVFYRVCEPRTPHRLHVAIVAANEHINAYLGHIVLSKRLLEDADPELRRLFEWHLAEEIEHKSVAHDVLTAVYPGYATRLAGAAIAIPSFYALVFGGAAWMLARDGELWRLRTARDLVRFWIEDGVLAQTLRHVGRYLRPGFHPSELDDSALAARILDELAVGARDRAERPS